MAGTALAEAAGAEAAAAEAGAAGAEAAGAEAAGAGEDASFAGVGTGTANTVLRVEALVRAAAEAATDGVFAEESILTLR